MGYKKSKISIASIVDAAVRVIARQGYAHTSLMDIASEVGMSKGAVHYHFPTKEALMAQVLQTACDEVATRTRGAWTQSDNPVEALRSSLRELWRVRAQLSDEAKVVADLLAQSLHDHTLRPPLAEYYRFASAQVEEHLNEHLDHARAQAEARCRQDPAPDARPARRPADAEDRRPRSDPGRVRDRGARNHGAGAVRS